MATAEQVRALVKSHSEGDDARFMSIAMQVAASEAKKGNSDFAAELRTLIDRAREKSLRPAGIPIPFSTPQGELRDLLSSSNPELRLDDMVLPEEVRLRLERILEEQREMALLKGHNLRPKQRLLLVGPPGCGKTMTAGVLAGELGLPLFVVRLDGLVTKFMGETGAKLRLIFDAMERTRAVYLFDEFDSIGLERGSGQDVGEMRRVLNSFLMMLEHYHGSSIVIAATNHGHALDTALFRRFDDVIEFTAPTKKLIAQAIKRRLTTVPAAKTKLPYDKLAAEADGLSYAEVVRACDDALKEMLLRRRSTLSAQDLSRVLQERLAFSKRRP